MITTIKKIYYGDTGSGDYAEVTVDSIENHAILLGNDSISDRKTVVFSSHVYDLIEALQDLKTNYL